jgi:hypothetical protein
VAIDGSERRTRRAIIGAGLGALGATVVSGLGGASPGRAADGDPIMVGSTVSGTLVTSIANTTNNHSVLVAQSTTGTGLIGTTGSDVGVRGTASTGIGVKGESQSSNGLLGSSASSNAIYGTSNATTLAAIEGQSVGNSTGVLGWSGTGSPPPARARTGVYGFAVQDNTSVGTYGESSTGTGVFGLSHSTVRPAIHGASLGDFVGVYGRSGNANPPPAINKIGVFGQADQDVNSTGVFGLSSSGRGVIGSSTSATGVGGTSGSGVGVFGQSVSGVGVVGLTASSEAAVFGRSGGDGTGVMGHSGGAPLPTSRAKTGVYGFAAQDATSVGVRGESTPGIGILGIGGTVGVKGISPNFTGVVATGTVGVSAQGGPAAGGGVGVSATGIGFGARGVEATASSGGIALHASNPSTDGMALVVAGWSLFRTSGIATVAGGKSTVTVGVPGLTSDAFVMATLQQSRPGVWVTAVTKSTSSATITIRLNKMVSTQTTVGWLLLRNP